MLSQSYKGEAVKINTSMSNINHMEQRGKVNNVEKKEVDVPREEQNDIVGSVNRNFSHQTVGLSKNIQGANISFGKLNVLEDALDSLEDGAKSLERLAERYNSYTFSEKEKEAQRDKFHDITEEMMDIVDNTIYDNKSLFAEDIKVEAGSASVTLDVPSIDISELTIDNQSTIEAFLSQMDSFGNDISLAKNVYNVRMFNSMAAMSTMVSKDDWLLEQRFQAMNVATIAGNHNAELLREQMSALLD